MSKTKTVLASIFNAYPKSVQESLIAQDFVVIDDPVEDETVTSTAEGQVDLLSEEADDEEDSGLFINIFVNKGDKRYKLTFASLDNDFVKYLDKEHTQRNTVRDAIVSAVETAGFEEASEKINFSVELTKKGEHGSINLLD